MSIHNKPQWDNMLSLNMKCVFFPGWICRTYNVASRVKVVSTTSQWLMNNTKDKFVNLTDTQNFMNFLMIRISLVSLR